MNLLHNFLFLIATAPPGPVPEKPSAFGPEFFVALMIFLVASIFLIQKPKQRMEQAKRREADKGLKKGTKVVSAGGIHGTVGRTNKARDTVFVTVAKGVEMEFNRSALNVVKEEEPKEEDKDKDKKESKK